MNEGKVFSSSFLFVTPTFLTGAGTVINLAGDYYMYNRSNSGQEADLRAISSDFGVIGNDLRAAIEEIKSEKLISK